MASSRDIKKGPGRPATGRGAPILVRLQPDALSRLDAWREVQSDTPTRPEAIRRLVEAGLQRGARDAGAPTAWELLADLYESDPDWRARYGWEDKPDASIAEAVATAKAVARKKGVADALEGAADLHFNEAPAALPIKALVARVDPN